MFLLAFGCRCVRVSFGCVQRHTTARGWRVFCLRWRCRLWSCPRPLWASGGSAPCGLWFWLSLSGVGGGRNLLLPAIPAPHPSTSRQSPCCFAGVSWPFVYLFWWNNCLLPIFSVGLSVLFLIDFRSSFYTFWVHAHVAGFFFFTFLSVFAFTLSVVSFKK